MQIAALSLAHAQLTIATLVGGGKQDQIPPLEAFVPDIPVEEPEPLTFEDWARHLLPLAGGRV